MFQSNKIHHKPIWCKQRFIHGGLFKHGGKLLLCFIFKWWILFYSIIFKWWVLFYSIEKDIKFYYFSVSDMMIWSFNIILKLVLHEIYCSHYCVSCSHYYASYVQCIVFIFYIKPKMCVLFILTCQVSLNFSGKFIF